MGCILQTGGGQIIWMTNHPWSNSFHLPIPHGRKTEDKISQESRSVPIIQFRCVRIYEVSQKYQNTFVIILSPKRNRWSLYGPHPQMVQNQKILTAFVDRFQVYTQPRRTPPPTNTPPECRIVGSSGAALPAFHEGSGPGDNFRPQGGRGSSGLLGPSQRQVFGYLGLFFFGTKRRPISLTPKMTSLRKKNGRPAPPGWLGGTPPLVLKNGWNGCGI